MVGHYADCCSKKKKILISETILVGLCGGVCKLYYNLAPYPYMYLIEKCNSLW